LSKKSASHRQSSARSFAWAAGDTATSILGRSSSSICRLLSHVFRASPRGKVLARARSVSLLGAFLELEAQADEPGHPQLEVFLDAARHLGLPALTLCIGSLATVSRQVRSAMLDVLREQFILAGRAKGLTEARVVYKHALKNAFVPTLTVIGISFAILLGGAVIIEQVFNIPGLGRLIISAVLRRDYPVIQGVILIVAGVYVLVNLAVDLAYLALDPRIRYR
jgi:ABC-type dipeptide/oligopeptide/nickel transport system permease component